MNNILDDQKMVPMTGFRFNPTDEELIEILNQKVVSGNVAAAFGFIVETNIYELEPQDLQWNRSVVALNNNERYYFCKRASDSREVAGRGWWKATSHVKTICANNNNNVGARGGVVGCKRPLTFHRFRDNQRNRKDAIRTDWIMHEYGLHSFPTEWRLCKIKYKGKERLEGKEEIIRTESSGSSISMQLELENQRAFEEQQPLMPPILPLNLNHDDDDYENYFWSNSSTACESSSLIINNMQRFDQAPGYQSFASQQEQDNHQYLSAEAEPMEQSPFTDLWSSW